MSAAESPSQDTIILLTAASGLSHGFLVHSICQPSDLSSVATIQQILDPNPSQDLLDSCLFRELPTYLDLPAEDLHILISTKSGTGKAEACFERLFQPVLRAIGLEDKSYNVIRTTSHTSVREFAAGRLLERAQKGIEQTVLLLSGDGGVVDLLNGLLGGETRTNQFSRPNVVLFPLGTGNALFHSLHRNQHLSIPDTDDLALSMRDFLAGDHHPLPIFQATFSPGSRLLSDEGRAAHAIPDNTLYGAVVASYGFHSTLVADSDTVEWRKHGAKRFGMVANQLLFPPDGSQPHAYKARMTLERETQEVQSMEATEYEYVLLSLVSNLEKSFTISPASTPLDGKMRLVHFGPRSGNEIMEIMKLAYQDGKHVEEGLGLVGYEEVNGMKIDMLEDGEDGRWRRVCIDGLIVRIEEGGWMNVSKVSESGGAIDVVLRQNT